MKEKNLKKTFFGLPSKVVFCKKTLVSNQRPNSEIEYKHNKKTKKKTMFISKNGLSDAWIYSRIKKKLIGKKESPSFLDF